MNLSIQAINSLPLSAFPAAFQTAITGMGVGVYPEKIQLVDMPDAASPFEIIWSLNKPKCDASQPLLLHIPPFEGKDTYVPDWMLQVRQFLLSDHTANASLGSDGRRPLSKTYQAIQGCIDEGVSIAKTVQSLRVEALPVARKYIKTCELANWIVAGTLLLCSSDAYISDCADIFKTLQGSVEKHDETNHSGISDLRALVADILTSICQNSPDKGSQLGGVLREELSYRRWSNAILNKAPDPIYDPLRIFLSLRDYSAYDGKISANITRSLQRFHELYPLMPEANLRLAWAQTMSVIQHIKQDELNDTPLEGLPPDIVTELEAASINTNLIIENYRRAGLIDAPRTTGIDSSIEEMTFASQHIENAISIFQGDSSRLQDVAILKAFQQRALAIVEEVRVHKEPLTQGKTEEKRGRFLPN